MENRLVFNGDFRWSGRKRCVYVRASLGIFSVVEFSSIFIVLVDVYH